MDVLFHVDHRGMAPHLDRANEMLEVAALFHLIIEGPTDRLLVSKYTVVIDYSRWRTDLRLTRSDSLCRGREVVRGR